VEQIFGQKYLLTRPLGKGAMGIVYEATHRSLRRPVAIKVLLSQYTGDQGAMKRFFREALAVSYLKSRYVVRVFDCDVTPAGAPYIVMESLTGTDLSVRLSEGDVAPETVVDWTIQICSAMFEAHARGIIHRDLKPSNLFLLEDNTIRVLDFGVSRIADGVDLTARSEIVGTPAYIAPEVLKGKKATPQSDLWAICVIAYKALSGHFPCEPEGPDRNAMSAMVATLSVPATPLRTFRPDLPEGLCDAIMKGLAKAPDDRYTSARALSDALKPFASAGATFEELTSEELSAIRKASEDPELLSALERQAATLAASTRPTVPDLAEVQGSTPAEGTSPAMVLYRSGTPGARARLSGVAGFTLLFGALIAAFQLGGARGGGAAPPTADVAPTGLPSQTAPPSLTTVVVPIFSAPLATTAPPSSASPSVPLRKAVPAASGPKSAKVQPHPQSPAPTVPRPLFIE
jgi:eukaryotic-like serine/threonine-protein kinase